MSHSCVVTVLISAVFHDHVIVAPLYADLGSTSWLNHKPNHHEWNHICLISDQKNFGFADFYNVHEIKALWTHLNESRLGRSELLMKWSDHSWRRNFLLVNVISLSFTDHVTSTCSTEIWLLFLWWEFNSSILFNLEMSSEQCPNIKIIHTRQILVHRSLHS